MSRRCISGRQYGGHRGIEVSEAEEVKQAVETKPDAQRPIKAELDELDGPIADSTPPLGLAQWDTHSTRGHQGSGVNSACCGNILHGGPG